MWCLCLIFLWIVVLNEYCWLDVMNSILYDLNSCKTLYLWCWKLVLRWVVVLEQVGGLHDVIRWFKFILGVFECAIVNEYCWLDVMNSILYDLNYRKNLYLWWWKLILWWVVVLEQAGGLHGVIRWFKFILGVFECAMYICLGINIGLCIHEWDIVHELSLFYLSSL